MVRDAPLWTFRALTGKKGWRLGCEDEVKTLREFKINCEFSEPLEKSQVSFAIRPGPLEIKSSSACLSPSIKQRQDSKFVPY